jgi:hypothetical protein
MLVEARKPLWPLTETGKKRIEGVLVQTYTDETGRLWASKRDAQGEHWYVVRPEPPARPTTRQKRVAPSQRGRLVTNKKLSEIPSWWRKNS